jgi:hypothetical protein
VDELRRGYRADQIAPSYNGWRHLAFTTAACLGASGVAFGLVTAWSTALLATVIAALLVSNLVEYSMHRWTMHHPRFRASRIYKRHIREHHLFFSRERLAVDGHRDFAATLFPPWLSVVFIVVLAMPASLVWSAVVDRSAGLVFYGVTVLYYLAFEWLHLGAHLPATSALGRLPLVRWARHHHGVHHDPARMREINYNFAFPLCDWLFRTFTR